MPGDAVADRTRADARVVLARAVAVVVASAAAAAALAALKGRGLDAAYVIGNSSALYLLVPFLAGLLMPRRVLAIGLGIVATTVALAAFYVTASALYLGRLSLDFSLGRWFLAGAVSGTLLALVGHAAQRRRHLLYPIPALLLLEPAGTAIATVLGHGSGAPFNALLIAGALEAATGALVLALLLLLYRRRRTRSHHPGPRPNGRNAI